MRKLRWAVLPLMAMLVLVACGSSGASGGSAQSTSYTQATEIDQIVTLDPNESYENLQPDYWLYSTLVTYPGNDTSKVIPSVAKSWSMSSNGKDWTFNLRSGIKFSSGNTLTASDVQYSVQRVVSLPENPAAWLMQQLGLTPTNVTQLVTAPNPQTVKFNLPTPVAPNAFLAILAFPVLGIVDAKTVKAHVTKGDFGHAWLDDHSAGSGPFVLNQWNRGSDIIETANPHYDVTKKPSLQRVVFQNVTESSAQYDLLQKGDADLADGMTLQQIQQLKGNKKFHIYSAPELDTPYLGMDVKNVPAFANVDVREAIKYAIDYSAIVNQLFQGHALNTQDFFPKGMYAYSDVQPFSQNIPKAKSLLAQGGYPNGFTFTMSVSNSVVPGGVSAADLATILKSDLAKIGVTANIQQVEPSQLLTEYRAQKLQAVVEDWGADYPDPDDFAKPFGDYNEQSLAWRLSWNDPSLSAMIVKAGQLPNGPQRLSLYNQINQVMFQQSPFAVLYQPLSVDVTSSDLHHVEINPEFGIDLLTVTKS